MADRTNGRRAARVAGWIVAAAVAAAVAFAPVLQGGFCADSSIPGRSYCATFARSILGIDTSVWLWLAATAVLCGLAALVSWRAKGRSTDRA